MSPHSVKICQFDVIHGQCPCGVVDGRKPIERVDCNMPDLHRPLETQGVGWDQ